MNVVLVMRSFRDAWPLLISCAALAFGFTWLRVWVASQIKADAFIKFFSESLQIFQSLLPVPIAEFATPLARVAFTYEEFGLVLLLGLWAITRGTESLAGRIGAGTMEMLLAQPLRRITVLSTHTVVTLAGVLVVAMTSWLGVRMGLAVSNFESAPKWTDVAPGTANFVGLGFFITGAATFVSAAVRSRGNAVGLMIGFYIVEIALMIVARVSERFEWMQWLTILSAYEPTLLTLALHRQPESFWPMFWQYNAWMIGLGATLWALSAVIFCRRDVPAPL
jgi:ABC-type transport system involved in multi-copper enzyme maturation permease subunit